MAPERYRRNNIATLTTDDGICVDDHTGKEVVLFHSFKQRLDTSSHNDMKFDLERIIKRIEGLDALTVPFTHAEIDHVIKQCRLIVHRDQMASMVRFLKLLGQ